jgi:hypothetical protein
MCTATDSDCQQGTLMTYVAAPKRVAQPSTPPSPESAAEGTSVSSLASHVGQNPDGTWNSTEQTDPWASLPKKRKSEESHIQRRRRQGPPHTAASQIDEWRPVASEAASETTALESDGVLLADMVTSPGPPGKKRKAVDDDDFLPPSANVSLEIHGDGVLTSKETRCPKRNATAKKYRQSVQEDKPAPFGQPPVWADKRQGLCEALPYYKAYQSGAHINNGIVRGFLVDKEVGPRDKFEEEIMISRV